MGDARLDLPTVAQMLTRRVHSAAARHELTCRRTASAVATEVAVRRMYGDAVTRELWDREASRFDEEPDHGLADPRVRAAWCELLLLVLPTAPARVLDAGAARAR